MHFLVPLYLSRMYAARNNCVVRKRAALGKLRNRTKVMLTESHQYNRIIQRFKHVIASHTVTVMSGAYRKNNDRLPTAGPEESVDALCPVP